MQQPEASRIVEDTSIRILDELAVEGGRASRAHLFDQCQVKLWGHVANVAARRAGYTGQNEAEIERHGKEQLFLEAVSLLLEREQIVVWDEEGKVLALHPTHRDDYVPGTNLWRSQRQQALTELRGQLMQFRDGKIIGDQPFDATLQKAIALFAQQLRRGQLAGDLREDAIGELLALADVLFDPARLATLFGIDELVIRAAAVRRLQPEPPTGTASKRRRTAKSEESPPTNPTLQGPGATLQEPPSTLQPPESALQGHGPTLQDRRGAEGLTKEILRRERLARELSLRDVSNVLGVSASTVGDWERGEYRINPMHEQNLLKYFATHPITNGQGA